MYKEFRRIRFLSFTFTTQAQVPNIPWQQLINEDITVLAQLRHATVLNVSH
jgi:hypothetical protein